MKHTQEAYEALVDKLKADLEEAAKDEEKSQRERIDIEQIFRDFIYNHHGKQVLMSLAKEIDKKTGRENDYTQFVDIEYDED